MQTILEIIMMAFVMLKSQQCKHIPPPILMNQLLMMMMVMMMMMMMMMYINLYTMPILSIQN